VSSKNKTNLLNGILFQFFWPFGGFLFSFNKVSKGQTTIIYILLAGYFGFVYVPAPESDMVRYLAEFVRISRLNFQNLYQEIISGEFSDYYTVTLSYFVSYLTYDPKIYLAIASMIFAYFYLKSISLILNSFALENSIFSTILIFILHFYVSIFFINGLRFYTAFFVFFYTLIQIYFFKNRKFYCLLAVIPLIHLSYAAPVAIFLIFSLFGKWRTLSFLVLLISIFSSLTDFNFSYLQGENKAQEKIISYTNAESASGFYEYIEENRSKNNQKNKVFVAISEYHYYFVLIFFVLILLSKKKLLIEFDNYDPKLINLNIYFLSLVFFTQNIAESYRFKHIFVFLFFISVVTVFYKLVKVSLFRKLFLFVSLGVLPYIFSILYINLQLTSVNLYFSNWIIVYFFNY
jgi:hypothetical protein